MTVSALVQFAVGAMAGAVAMLAGIMVGHLSGWREVSAILEEPSKWMAAQEKINLSLMRALADVRMRSAVAGIVAHYRASQSEAEE